MKKESFLILFLSCLFLAIPVVFAQQNETAEFLVEEWVLGDVTSLDLDNNQFVLTYIDQQGDEQEVNFKVNANTKYDNVSQFKDIKIGDVVGVDYRVNSKGETIAFNISLERIKKTG